MWNIELLLYQMPIFVPPVRSIRLWAIVYSGYKIRSKDLPCNDLESADIEISESADTCCHR